MDRISVRRLVDKMIVKEGSLWWAGDSKRFRVLSVTEQDGHTWVHYRDELKGFDQSNSKEYSCYIESFLERFKKIPE